jgi:hypothetical protein
MTMKYKKDDRPKKGFWSPGRHLDRCHTCGELFIGAKLCIRCADCEYAPAPQKCINCTS